MNPSKQIIQELPGGLILRRSSYEDMEARSTPILGKISQSMPPTM